jgi:ABC-type multidrug transport system ATPase subunit
LKANGGAATAFNKDLLKLESSTNMLSVCPQHNVLLTKMTVKENIIFFSKFRGDELTDETIEEMLGKFNMKP